MIGKLEGKKVAIVVTDGFEESHLTHARSVLEGEGATCVTIAPKEGTVLGWWGAEPGAAFAVDLPVVHADADDFDALFLPGGVLSADKLRTMPDVKRFVRRFFATGRKVGAIGHGLWTLIDAGVVESRRMTSCRSLRTDLENAGADWLDDDVVVDGVLITARGEAELPAFLEKLVDGYAEEPHVEARRPLVVARVSSPTT